jgi:hypothetical protein
MNQAEALRRALADLGNVSAKELAAHRHKTYGVNVRPQFVPILKATFGDRGIDRAPQHLARRLRKPVGANGRRRH